MEVVEVVERNLRTKPAAEAAEAGKKMAGEEVAGVEVVEVAGRPCHRSRRTSVPPRVDVVVCRILMAVDQLAQRAPCSGAGG